MLKTRIIPTLLFKDLGLVKGIGFDSWRRVGAVHQSVKVYNLREVDELVFLDITATPGSRPPDYELIDEIADECFMPLTVGGGIRSIKHVHRLLQVGADKVAVNTAAVEVPSLISEVARDFGSQCVVVSIDTRRHPDGSLQVCTRSGTMPVDHDPVALARRAEDAGAGEILLTSIDRDGTMEGYDLPLIRAVSDAVSIPVIASGGAGRPEDMVSAVENGAVAVAAASLFHFTQTTPRELKNHLHNHRIPVRL